MIEKYLNDLENRIDSEVEDNLFKQWKDFIYDKNKESIFTPKRHRKIQSILLWPEISINHAIDDYEMMAFHQFGLCSEELAKASGKLLAIRCNYGTSIMPTIFGAELFIMDENFNTLPTSKPLTGGINAVKALLDNGIPNLHTGLGSKVLEMGNRFVEMIQSYPKLSQYVTIYHPDLQGPMDICEILWGSSMFVHFYDSPDLMKDFLNLITETYAAFMREWKKIVPFSDGYAIHWSMLHQGQIMLRDDSAMNLSPEMFEEFIKPYDQRLLDEFGGGAIHFCGKGDHFIPRVSEINGLYAIAMSQPELNNMEIIFSHTIDKNIKLLGLKRPAAEEALKRGRNLHGNIHCW